MLIKVIMAQLEHRLVNLIFSLGRLFIVIGFIQVYIYIFYLVLLCSYGLSTFLLLYFSHYSFLLLCSLFQYFWLFFLFSIFQAHQKDSQMVRTLTVLSVFLIKIVDFLFFLEFFLTKMAIIVHDCF